MRFHWCLYEAKNMFQCHVLLQCQPMPLESVTVWMASYL
uniref:Uncharacterized protein n=1 Tax=Rhizophora mucronata TaxID=61149 RepID=A0A2P2NAW5_RHIMU